MRKVLAVLLVLYVAVYPGLRLSWAERWDRDGRTYVIFPAAAPWLYYLYRPLAHADGQLSGMRFHLGPHPQE